MVNTGPGNGLLTEGTKLLPEPMLTLQKRVPFQCDVYLNICDFNLYIRNHIYICQG